MRHAIYKYHLPLHNLEVVIRMPQGAKVLSTAVQHGMPCVWAMVNPEAPRADHRFAWRGTGHSCDDLTGGAGEAQFVGSLLFEDGTLVFHLFYRGEVP